MQFSADGEWFWDGTQWRAAYSPDRGWRWDGTTWRGVPTSTTAWHYEPTVWTRRMQGFVLLVMVLSMLAPAILFPTVARPLIQHSIDQSVAVQASNPDVDPAQLRSISTSIVYGSMIVGGVVGAVFAAVLIVGVVRRWRWVYWYFVVTYLLAPLALPQDLYYVYGPGPVRVPAATLLLQVPLALICIGGGVWMIVLYRRHGTWARRRVPDLRAA